MGGEKVKLSGTRGAVATIDDGIVVTDMNPTDGIGRRKQDIKELNDGTHVVVSDFALITLINNLDTLKNRASSAEKKIVERMLRTAAAINVATGGRGVYNSRSKAKTPAAKEDAVQYSAKTTPFKPVALQSASE